MGQEAAGAATPTLLTVHHVTTYRYATPVRLGEHLMMVRPRASHDLRLLSVDLAISPTPTRLRWVHDVFDNSVAVVEFFGETTELRFDTTVTLEHIESPVPDYELDSQATRYPFLYPGDQWPELYRGLMRPDPHPEVHRWARGFVPEGVCDTMALLRAVSFGIRDQIAYRNRYEPGIQPAAQTLREASGSCRDLAWLMIDAVRSLGLAARFVSGYIFVPNTDEAPMLGGGNTHAWLQVYLPGAGWVDFDPTNSIIGNRHLIRVAVAWDPMHVAPLRGTFYGLPGAALGMEVKVTVTETPAAPGPQAMPDAA